MIIKRIPNGLKQTILYGVSIALMKGVSLLMLPYIASYLSIDEFGRLEVITALSIFASILVGMGLDQTLFRFAGNEKNNDKRKQLAGEIFGLTIIIGTVAALIGWFIAPVITEYLPGSPTVYEVRIVLLILALEGCISIPLGWLRMNDKAWTFFIMTTGRAALQAVLVFLFLKSSSSVESILEAGFIAAFSQVVLLSILQFKSTGVHFKLLTYRSALIYSLPIVGSGLVAFSLNGLDRWILAEQTTLNDVAQFGIAAKFGLALVLMLQPFTMWWSARRFVVLNDENGKDNVQKYITLGIVISLISAVIVGLSAPYLISQILPDTYAIASQYVIGMIVVMLLKELAELINIGCFIHKTTSTQLVINVIAAILGISCMVIFTPIYSVWGIIYALILAQTTRVILFYKFSQRHLPLAYPTLSIIFLFSFSISWLLLFPAIASLIQLFLSIIVSLTCLSLLSLFLKLLPITSSATNIACVR